MCYVCCDLGMATGTRARKKTRCLTRNPSYWRFLPLSLCHIRFGFSLCFSLSHSLSLSLSWIRRFTVLFSCTTSNGIPSNDYQRFTVDVSNPSVSPSPAAAAAPVLTAAPTLAPTLPPTIMLVAPQLTGNCPTMAPLNTPYICGLSASGSQPLSLSLGTQRMCLRRLLLMCLLERGEDPARCVLCVLCGYVYVCVCVRERECVCV